MLDPDVREILDDPEVGGGVKFTVYRSQQVRIKGSVKLETQTIHATGNIQPMDKSAMQNTAEDQLNEQIVIRTTTVLQNGTRTETGDVYGADEVLYRGSRWRVLRVDNWEDWGFVTAYATKVRE